MRALIQRVAKAQVDSNGETLSAIGQGLLVFLGVTKTDTQDEVDWLAGKISRLRIFTDDAGKMNRSVSEIGGAVLVVSQFTLYGDASKGNRPGFDQAAGPELAEPLYDSFCDRLRQTGLTVGTGRFGAHMVVSLVNDGPVTIWLERSKEHP
jgi:D-tyrosyl-tRNA(Tyr) deacylase